MKLIIGIGNPGEKYKHNRHNAGFLVVDRLKTRISNFPFDSAQGRQFPISNKFKIFKSDKFMNKSGKFVKKLVEQYKVILPNLWIIHDDLDIPLGSYKIQFGKGPKDHNGLNDIYDKLNTKDFWHVRIGVENRKTHGEPSGYDYVLEDFTFEERKILDRVIDEINKNLTKELTV